MQIPCSRPGPGRQRGFTLGEVLVTLGVIGASLSLVVPTLSSVTRDNLRATAINELVGTLHVARSEAITRNAPVVICPSTDGRTCASAPWESGWIRFVDSNGDYGADAGEAVLGAAPPVAGFRIETEAFGRAFGYGPNGGAAAPDGAPATGHFAFCTDDGAAARVVLIAPSGRPVLSDRLADGREPDCQPG